MSDYTIEVGNDAYKMNGNPSLRTVRIVQSMQNKMLRDHIAEERLMEMESLSEEDIVQAILDSGGYDAFEQVMWEKSLMEPVQTISLACDHGFDVGEFDDVGANEFKEYKEKAEEVLKGDVNDFFNGLGIGLSLSEEEMRRVQSMQGSDSNET